MPRFVSFKFVQTITYGAAAFGFGILCSAPASANEIPQWGGENKSEIRIPGATIEMTTPILNQANQAGLMAPNTLAMYYLSIDPAAGFAANINVQKQPYGGDLSGFRDISIQQFKTLGLTMLDEKLVGNGDDATLKIEYKGPLQGREGHFLAHAYKIDGGILLATCTSSPAPAVWAAVKPMCQKGLDSIRIKKD